MSKVITSFTRRRFALHRHNKHSEHDARHRRDGWFDEADNWHDAESESSATATDDIAR